MPVRGFTLTLLLAATATLSAQQLAARPAASSGTGAPTRAPFDREQYRIPHTRFVLDNGLAHCP